MMPLAWFHACLTWSSASHTAKAYVNGELRDSYINTNESLPTGHSIVLGNWSQLNLRAYFGGEMMDLNLYAKELSGDEVRRMADVGMCSLASDENEDVRLLKWEDILKKERLGTIAEIYKGDCVLALLTRMTKAEKNC